MSNPLNIGLSIMAATLLPLQVTPVMAEEYQDPRMARLEKLPKHLVAPESGLGLIADFEPANPPLGWIPVYLINNSGKDLQLFAQDGDVYLKLEIQQEDGSWKRAENHHDSFCGNSYMVRPVIPSGSFLLIRGYQPTEGESAKIRYKLYKQNIALETNTGTGTVNPADVSAASLDRLAISTENLECVGAIARGVIALPKPTPLEDRRGLAINELGSGRLGFDGALTILEEIAAGKDPKYTKLAKAALQRLKTQKR